MKHHPDFYAEDDDRPRFSEMGEVEQISLLHEFAVAHPEQYHSYYDEAISQCPDDYDAQRIYVSNCILHNYPDQEFVI